MSCGSRPRISWPSKRIEPAARGYQAGDGVAQRRLAHAVAADDRQNAALERQRHALKRVRFAVIDLQVLNLQTPAPLAAAGGLSMRRSEIDLLHLLVLLDLAAACPSLKMRPLCIIVT